MTAQSYIKGLQLRHFAPSEILHLGASHASNGLNDLPPEILWPNIVRTAQLADMARSALGTSIRVLSGYRNVAYNRSVGGATHSQHLKFNALDLGTSDPAGLLKILTRWRDAGVFKGGLGFYPSKGFVHLDTRGVNQTWAGK